MSDKIETLHGDWQGVDPRASVPVQALREWASAIRGDWGDIDGRSVKYELNDIADAIEGKKNTDKDIGWWRENLGLCPTGHGHWTRHCNTSEWGCGNEPGGW